MSAFTDQLDQDLANVFFNPDEFGSEHVLDGARLFGVKEDAQLAYPDGLLDDVRRRAILLHVRTGDIQNPVSIGRRVTLDGAPWTIEALTEACGMTSLTLSRAVS